VRALGLSPGHSRPLYRNRLQATRNVCEHPADERQRPLLRQAAGP
jgi:hypothetical protein